MGLINTDKSCLKVINLEDNINLKEIVNTIKDKLIENPPIMVYGKKCYQRRSIGFFSDDENVVGYYYSNQLAEKQPLDSLKPLLKIINEKFNIDFNGILINKYKNGEEYISTHSDDEKELGPNPTIASISLGSERDLVFRNKINKEVLPIPQTHGCLILIDGKTQKNWQHAIKKTRKVIGPRINLTFRNIIDKNYF